MFQRLTKELFFYAIGNFLQRGTTFVLIIVYTSALSVTEYGQYETIYAIVLVLMVLLNFGLNVALMRYCYDCENEQEFDTLMHTSIVMCLGLSGVFFLLFLPILQLIGRLYLIHEGFISLLFLSFLWAVGNNLNLQLFSYYRARRKVVSFVVLSFANFVLLILMNLALIYLAKLGLLGILLANVLIVWIVNLVMGVRFLIHKHSLSFVWGKKMLAYGFPLVFFNLALMILNSGDRLFLAYFRTFPEVAVYSLGYKVGFMVQMLVVQPFDLAWGPYVFNHYAIKKENAKPDYARIFTYLMLIFCIVGIGLYLFSPELVTLMGSGKIAEAARVVPYVIAASLFYSVFGWASTFILLVEKNIYLTTITILMAGLNTLLNWLWIPTMGWPGAAFSTIVSMIGLGMLTMLAAQSHFPVRLEWRRLAVLVFLVSVTAGVSLITPRSGSLASWAMRVAVLFLIPIGLILLRFFLLEEVSVVHNWISKVKSIPNYK